MRFLKLLCATAFLTVMGANAFAQSPFTINYSFGNSPASFTVNYKTPSPTTPGSPAGTTVSEPVYAGPLTATVAGNPSFNVYCVDLVGIVYPGNNYTVSTQAVVVGNPGSPPGYYYDNIRMAAWMFNEFESGNLDQSLDVFNDAGQFNQTNGAALQAAIWEIVEGNTDYSVTTTTGDFYITGASQSIIDQANNYLTLLKNASPNQSNGILYLADHSVSNTNGQNMLGGPGGFNPNAAPVTPEGSSLLLLLPGLLPVAVGLRRRRLNTPVGE